ncbi:MAG: magnesium/cobalt transporter CorA [Planctomycetes bacterium]|nr:magnesium/cobalt transporter CorA [Planctomycetota bacterium]
MSPIFGKRKKPAGLPPGSMVFTGDRKQEKVRITVIDYTEGTLEEKEAAGISDCRVFRDKPSVTWINIDGLHDTSVLETLGKDYDIHPLILEDIVHVDQRPKMEDLGEYIFIVCKMIYTEEGQVVSEQVSLILGPNYVISFQERTGDVFDPIRERIRNDKGRVRKLGADYLAYSLLDAIIDNYFTLLEGVGEKLEDLEEKIVLDPEPRTLQTLHGHKNDMVHMRRSLWPMRELVNGLERTDSKLIRKSTHIYLRDIYEHTVQVIDSMETFRDMMSSLQDLYLSSLSNRMNEVMKVLTIIATIFIPLTFIAGIYGMNFEYMPELGHPMAYPGVLVAMGLVALVMVMYFRRKKWL